MVRIAFRRITASFLATTLGVAGADVRDPMVAALEHGIAGVNRVRASIVTLGNCYIAGETRGFAKLRIGRPFGCQTLVSSLTSKGNSMTRDI